MSGHIQSRKLYSVLYLFAGNYLFGECKHLTLHLHKNTSFTLNDSLAKFLKVEKNLLYRAPPDDCFWIMLIKLHSKKIGLYFCFSQLFVQEETNWLKWSLMYSRQSHNTSHATRTIQINIICIDSWIRYIRNMLIFDKKVNGWLYWTIMF